MSAVKSHSLNCLLWQSRQESRQSGSVQLHEWALICIVSLLQDHTVACKDKTLPRIQNNSQNPKQFPESKTRPGIQKHSPECKNTSQNPKALPRIQKHFPDSDTRHKGAFLWDDPDQDQWSKITRNKVDQMNQWILIQSGFIGSFDLTWSEWSRITDPDPDHPKGTRP